MCFTLQRLKRRQRLIVRGAGSTRGECCRYRRSAKLALFAVNRRLETQNRRIEEEEGVLVLIRTRRACPGCRSAGAREHIMGTAHTSVVSLLPHIKLHRSRDHNPINI